MRRRLSLLLLVVLPLFPPDTAQGITIELHDAGQEPRRELRYQPVAGQREGLQMTLQMTMSAVLDGLPVPAVHLAPIQFRLGIRVLRVHSNGDFDTRTEMQSVQLQSAPDAPEALRQQFREQLAFLQSLRLDSTLSARGLTRAVTVNLDRSPPGMEDITGHIQQAIEQISMPLPQEAVGIGARWTVTMPLVKNEMRLTNRVKVRLTRLEPGQAVFEVQVEQQAAPQALPLGPHAPPGVRAQLLSLEANGQGQLRLQFPHLVPTRSELDSRTELVTQVFKGDERQTLEHRIRLQLEVKRIPTAAPPSPAGGP